MVQPVVTFRLEQPQHLLQFLIRSLRDTNGELNSVGSQKFHFLAEYVHRAVYRTLGCSD